MEFKLILKRLNNSLSKEEKKVFDAWFAESELHRNYFERVKRGYLKSPESVSVEEGWSKLSSKLTKERKRRSYLKYVAAAAILLVTSLPFLLEKSQTELPVQQITEKEIEVGTDKATLTLEDGTEVALEKGDSFNHKNVSSNGEQLVYKHKAEDSKTELVYNTLTIPRGGQFYVVLADSTRVWLNSDSKLRYPVNFADDQPRKVELVYGEAYFEVSPSRLHNGTHFMVETQGQEVDVLGTAFNIKAYREDLVVSTALVHGRVAINQSGNTEELAPGYQSVFDPLAGTVHIAKADVNSIVAWKDGLFNFKDMPLGEILVTISRWYNAELQIKNQEKAAIEFNGMFNRNQELEKILTIIENTNEVKLTTEGNTIIVE
ncbi:MAG: DUF4974 domain-containing protein [Algicola sp.]|nr:DUF4974 domain-containing protein [Algicola sp.]